MQDVCIHIISIFTLSGVWWWHKIKWMDLKEVYILYSTPINSILWIHVICILHEVSISTHFGILLFRILSTKKAWIAHLGELMAWERQGFGDGIISCWTVANKQNLHLWQFKMSRKPMTIESWNGIRHVERFWRMVVSLWMLCSFVGWRVLRHHMLGLKLNIWRMSHRCGYLHTDTRVGTTYKSSTCLLMNMKRSQAFWGSNHFRKLSSRFQHTHTHFYCGWWFWERTACDSDAKESRKFWTESPL